MVDLAQRLANLSTRPPTPPKERSEPTIESSSPNGYFLKVTEYILLDTPKESPSSSGEYFAGSSEKGSKKVEFSPWPLFHKSAMIGGNTPGSEGEIRRLPPSRDCKSSKSILKETFRSSPLAELPTLDANNIPKMLESAILHLKSASRTCRLDAYSALLGCMSVYDDVPDTDALLKRLSEFVGFIRRDICATSDTSGTLDTQLISQSLKLLIVFLCTPALANGLPDEFRLYILDQAISSCEKAELPKILVTHHMQVIAKQSFSGKHMTNERANRLMFALRVITEHQKGNSIIGLRLRIYQRLLAQAKSSMVAHAGHWIEHLVSGMLSTTKDIRALAINFGIDAGIGLGSTSSVSQACYDLFSRTSPEAQTVVDFLATRLNAMTASKDEGVHVPQIWSVVILLLRNRRRKLERWPHLKSWLLIIQKCFNSNEAHIKLLAMTAWNRLVFVVEPEASTTPSMIKMLRQPIAAQLNRKGSDKHSKQSKQIAQSSYCNLLYYAFRPHASHAQLDIYWGYYVDQIIPNNFTSAQRDIDRACEILATLLYNEQPNTWDESRANTTGFIKPNELPSLDPKWIRSRANKILIVFGKLLRLATWNSVDRGKLPIILAWKSFTMALGEAAKQEVKVSLETISAVAEILNMLKKYLDQAYFQQPDAPTFDSAAAMVNAQALIEEAILHIGSIPFNEPRITRSSRDLFEAAETPSGRAPRHQKTSCSPTTHLLRLLVTSTANDAAVEASKLIMQNLVEVALSSASSRRSQLGIMRDLIALTSVEDAKTSKARVMFWCLIAEAAESAFGRSRASDKNSESPQYAGHEFRDAAKILEMGIQHHSSEAIQPWQELFAVVCKALQEEIGDGGIALIITEPLADAIHRQLSAVCNDTLLTCATFVVTTAAWPRSQQVLDRARKLLWGIAPAIQKPGATDPFDKLYLMIASGLIKAYEEIASTSMSYVADFLLSLEKLLSSVSTLNQGLLLRRTQRGLASWVEDRKGVIAGVNVGTDLEKVQISIQALWTTCRAVVEASSFTNVTLVQFEDLVTSSLSTRHRSILNDAIILWNSTFGTADRLEYNDKLRKALSRLSTVAELQLPTFPYEEDTETTSSPFEFIESQDSQRTRENEEVLTPAKPADIGTKIPMKASPTKPASSLRGHPTGSGSKSLRRTIGNRVSKTPTKARLRHDDSQVVFAAIDSSPLAFDDTDSRILTDHQQETKERQVLEAAMFPTFSSSPARRANQELPRLMLRGNDQPPGATELEDQTSPALPVIDGDLEAFLGSSPTPRSSRKLSSNPLSDGGPPSSPPGLPSLAAVFPRPAEKEPATAVNEKRVQAQSEDVIRPERPQEVPAVEGPAVNNVVNDQEVAASGQQDGAAVLLDGEQRHVAEDEAATIEPTDTRTFSDFDIFVDAPTEPVSREHTTDNKEVNTDHNEPAIPSSPASAADPAVVRVCNADATPQTTIQAVSRELRSEDENAMSQVTDSFPSQSSQHSNDDEQISAQLAADMERASSQAERDLDDSRASASKKKRKRGSSASTASAKRLRSHSKAQECHVVVRRQKPEATDDDCIILDTRSADNSTPCSSPVVKQERSTPTSNIARQATSTGKLPDEIKGPSPQATTSALPPSAEEPEKKAHQAATGRARKNKGKSSQDSASQTPARRRSARQIQMVEKPDQEMQEAPEALSPTPASTEPDPAQIASSLQDQAPSPSPRKSAYRRLMDGFRNLISDLKQVTLKAEEERAVTGVLFESILEVHEAGKRHPRS